MRKLWDFWKNKKYGKKSMTGWFLLTNALLCGVIGAALWGVVSLVANLEKKVPLSWMNENHTQMTEDFLDYARPLIQAELTPLYIAGLPHHIYMKK